MSEVQHLTFDEWWDKFKPIKNHLTQDGILYETYGPEGDYAFERRTDKNIWTFLDDEKIIEGYHRVNRLGYIFTQENHNKEYEIDCNS